MIAPGSFRLLKVTTVYYLHPGPFWEVCVVRTSRRADAAAKIVMHQCNKAFFHGELNRLYCFHLCGGYGNVGMRPERDQRPGFREGAQRTS